MRERERGVFGTATVACSQVWSCAEQANGREDENEYGVKPGEDEEG